VLHFDQAFDQRDADAEPACERSSARLACTNGSNTWPCISVSPPAFSAAAAGSFCAGLSRAVLGACPLLRAIEFPSN